MTINADQQKENLEFLWRVFQSNPGIQRALELHRSLSRPELASLLRHHGKGEVSRSEAGERDAWDQLLAAYSQLAVAAIAGYVPIDFGPEINKAIYDALKNSPVRTYYESHYKLLLPSLLRLHCEGDISLPCEQSESAMEAFEWFWRFENRFGKSSEVETFLRLLDGCHYGDFDLSAFKRFLKDPITALAGLSKTTFEQSIEETAVLGMIRFLEFCQELGDALEEMKDIPLTQSAIWFYYAYWFEEFKSDVAEQAITCIGTMREWVKKSNRETQDAALESEERVRRAVHALTSGVYSEALLDGVRSKV